MTNTHDVRIRSYARARARSIIRTPRACNVRPASHTVFGARTRVYERHTSMLCTRFEFHFGKTTVIQHARLLPYTYTPMWNSSRPFSYQFNVLVRRFCADVILWSTKVESSFHSFTFEKNSIFGCQVAYKIVTVIISGLQRNIPKFTNFNLLKSHAIPI